MDINALKIRIADFNSKSHSLENLHVNSLYTWWPAGNDHCEQFRQ